MTGDLTAASPLAEGVYALLQNATLQTALGGRLYDALPANVARPCVLVEVLGERDIRGFGTGGLPECDLRTHVFSDVGSMAQAQLLNTQIVALLKDAAVTVTGYTQAGRIVYRESITLPDELLNGVPVHEVVSLFTVWVEET